MNVKSFLPISCMFCEWLEQENCDVADPGTAEGCVLMLVLGLIVGLLLLCALLIVFVFDIVSSPFRFLYWLMFVCLYGKMNDRLYERIMQGRIDPRKVEPFVLGSRSVNPKTAVVYYRDNPPNLLDKDQLQFAAAEFIEDQLGRSMVNTGDVLEKCELVDLKVDGNSGFLHLKFQRVESVGVRQRCSSAHYFLELLYARSDAIIHTKRFAFVREALVEDDGGSEEFDRFVRHSSGLSRDSYNPLGHLLGQKNTAVGPEDAPSIPRVSETE